MAATVQGVFTIVDRASPKMRTMRHEAERTQASIESLGASLDKLGVQKDKLIKNFGNLERRMKVVEQRTHSVASRVKESTSAIDKHSSAVRKTETFWKRLSGTVGMMGRDLTGIAGKFIGFSTAIGVAGQAIAQLSGGVLGLASRVGTLGSVFAGGIAGITGLGLAAVTAKLAFSNFSQAMAGNAKAIGLLTPQARYFLIELKRMTPVFNEFKRSAQGGLFAGLTSALGNLRTAVPTVNRMLANMSNVLGGVIAQQSRRFTRGGFLADLERIGGQGGTMVGALGRSLGNIISALRHVAIAAMPFTNWLTRTIEGWTKFAEGAAASGRATGRLGAWFQRAERNLTQIGHILRNLWQGFQALLRAAQPLGDLLFRDAERGSKAWATMLGSQREQTRLMTMMLGMEPGIKAMFRLVGDLGRALFQMGSSRQFARTIDNLRGAIPPLQQALSKMADTFGPAFGTAIANLAKLFADVSTMASPLVVAAKAIGQIAGFVDRLVRASPFIKDVFGILFSTLIISRYLIKLGILEKGWWNVFRAATAAAGAERAATAVGPGGVGTTIMGTGRRGSPGGGPVILGPTGRGVKGFFGRLFGRGGGAAATRDAGYAARTAALGGRAVAAESVLGAAATAGGRGALLGRLGGGIMGGIAARGGIGLASKALLFGAGRFLAPIAAIQGIFGALTAQRSGSFGHQAAQTAYGGINAATGGLLGGGLGLLGAHHILETPESRAARAASTGQQRVDQQLANVAGVPGSMANLTARLRILNQAARDVSDRQTQASKDYIQSLKDQTSEIKNSIKAMKEQQAARDRQKAGGFLATEQRLAESRLAKGQGYGSVIRRGDTDVLRQINNMIGHPAAQAGLRSQVLRNAYINRNAVPGEYQRVSQAIVGQAAAGGKKISTYGPVVITGSQTEQRGIISTLANNGIQQNLYRSQKQPTAYQGRLIQSFITAGMPRAEAEAYVLSGERDDYKTLKAWSPAMQKNLFSGNYLGRRATGGRIGGKGLNDTVPMGGSMTAPGELVVNRHTEHRVNALLGSNTLGAMVAGENKPHKAMAKGGRLSWDPGITGNKVNRTLLGDVKGLTSEGDVRITSGFRTLATQKQLYYNYTHGTGGIAAKPGLSAHEYGLAMDVFVNGAGAQALGAKVLARHGLVAPVGGDSVHVELANNSPQLLGLATAIAAAKGDLGSILRPGMTGKKGGAVPPGMQGPVGAGGGAGGGLPSLLTDQFAAVDSLTGVPGFTTVPVVTKPTAAGGGKGGGRAAAAGATGKVGKGEAHVGGDSTTAANGLRWAMALSKSMGIDPRVTRDWVNLEGAWNGTGWFNYLNLMSQDGTRSYSGVPLHGVTSNAYHFQQFKNPQDSLHETLYWLRNMSNYKGLRDAIPHGAQAQIAAITGSKFEEKGYPGRTWSLAPLQTGGRMPQFAGWHAAGMNGTFSTPTLIGVGEKGSEKVSVTPTGKSGSGAKVTLNNTFHITGGEPGAVQREVEAAMLSLISHIENNDVPE